MNDAVTPPPSPQSPGHQPEARSPFAAPDPWDGAGPTAKTPRRGLPVTAGEVRDAAAVTLIVGVCGLLLGLLWAWLAPRVQYVSNGEAVFLAETEGEARIGADGTFLLLSIGFGVLSGAAVWLWRRASGPALVVGLALGSGFAALAGWRLGLWLGPGRDLAAEAIKAGKGVPFDAPLQLLAHAVLLGWPMAALVTHLLLTAVLTPREPAPEPYWPGSSLVADAEAPQDAAPPADHTPAYGSGPYPAPAPAPNPYGTPPPPEDGRPRP
ncbi:hypothetical protein ACN20G_20260 [Streptomyces sp. BI20]|uniref:hypothetical protein n=1 Tax=Streptomyces sp. BI20 TaxID=3403460 RepID=UPI003C7312E3